MSRRSLLTVALAISMCMMLASSASASGSCADKAKTVTITKGKRAKSCVRVRCRRGIMSYTCRRTSLGTRLFSADSVWNSPVGGAALDATNGTRMAAFGDQIRTEMQLGWGPWISETSYSTPFVVVGRAQPKVAVKLDTGAWGDPLRRALASGVPIPRAAKPAAGSDGHLTIYQPSTDTLWEFWKAVKRSDGWHASWGGAMQHVSENPGYYDYRAWAGLPASQGWNWGSTATSLPVIAGTIMVDELRRERIDHALALAIPNPCATKVVWPAQRGDGGNRSGSCLPEGAHLRLDPALDLSKLSMPHITRVIAEAAQKYGMIVRDKTGHATGFYAEDPSTLGADPYIGPMGLYGGLRPWNFLRTQFPWEHVQLLKMQSCENPPCHG